MAVFEDDFLEHRERNRRAVERQRRADDDVGLAMVEQRLAVDMNAGRQVVAFGLVAEMVERGEFALLDDDWLAAGRVAGPFPYCQVLR